MLARRDTRREASRLRHLSPLQTLEDQSQTWGIRCHSCTWREGLPPSWKLSYKITSCDLPEDLTPLSINGSHESSCLISRPELCRARNRHAAVPWRYGPRDSA